jgi:hypothetical protein
VVNQSSRQVLADANLTRDEDVAIRSSRAIDPFLKGTNRTTSTDEPQAPRLV